MKRNVYLQKLMSKPSLWRNIVFLSAYVLATNALAIPEGGQVASGNVTITTPSATTMQINQTTNKGIINWQSFNIQANEKVHFNQPSATSSTLNRINPTQGVSQIYGQLTANGQIILSNPAGIYFGPNSFVNVGGMIATTGQISDHNFNAGLYQFTANPDFRGAIINEGFIKAASEGLIALAAPSVMNNGMIEAHMGQVVLASGEAFTVGFAADGLINFKIDKEANTLSSGVTQSGKIYASGGKVLITAEAARGVLDKTINMTGYIEANSVGVRQGQIILNAGSGGKVHVSGKMYASGKKSGEKGGKIQVLGDQVVLKDQAYLDVSGDLGGGEVLVGGDFQGKNPNILNAAYTFVDPGVNIYADALTRGDGGKVIVWADNYTQYLGNIFARGGAVSGNGGFLEISGKENLAFNGKVNMSAPFGLNGSLLLDPKNINVVTGGADAYTGNNTYALPNATYTSAIDPTSIQSAATNGGTITLSANNDVTFTDQLDISSTTSALNVFAGRNINVYNLIKTNGALLLSANRSGDAGETSANRDAGVGGILIGSNGSTTGSLNSQSSSTTLTVGSSTTSPYSPGNIDILGTVNSGTFTVNAPKAVTVNAALTHAGAATYNVNTSGGTTNSFKDFIISTSGSITNNNAVSVNVNSAASGDGGIYLNNTGANNINTSSGNGNISLRTEAGGAINQTGGPIQQDSTSQITLNAGSGTVTLNVPSGSSNPNGVGTSAKYIQMQSTGSLFSIAGTAGIYIKNTGSFLTIQGPSTTGSLNIIATGGLGHGFGTNVTSTGDFNYTTLGGNLSLAGSSTYKSLTGNINFNVSGNYSATSTSTIDTTGANGAITVTASGTTGTSFQVGPTAVYKAGSGTITFNNTSTGTMNINAGAQIYTTGNIYIYTDILTGSANNSTQVGGSAANTGRASLVTIAPYNANTTIGVAGGTGSMAIGTFLISNSSSSASTILADNIVYGRSNSGLVTVAGFSPLSGFGATNFSIVSGAGITHTGTLSLSTSGSSLTENAVGTITPHNITTNNKDISLTGANITHTAATTINAGTGNITENASTGTLTLNGTSLVLAGNASGTAGNITFIADNMSFNGTSQIGGTGSATGGAQYVILKPSTNSRTIGIAGGSGSLALSSAALDRIYAKTVEIGGTSKSGDISLAAWSPNFHVSNGAIALNTTGAITQSGILNLSSNTASLLLRNASGVTLTQNNVLNKIAANIAGSLSAINNGATALTVDSLTDSIGTVAGITAPTGVTLRTLNASSSLVLNSGINTTNTNIILTTPVFTNNAGSGALSMGSGNFNIWSANPTSDTRGGLAYNFKQYNATYGSTSVSGSGNGFLYTAALSLTPVLTSTITKVYDTTTTATLAGSNYTASGTLDGEIVTFNNPTSGSYNNKNVGTSKLVTANGVSIVSVTDGAGAAIYGYTLASSTATGNIGEITAYQLTTPTLKSTISKTYDATTTATLTDANYNALTGVLGSDVVALNNPTSGNYNNKNVGTNKNVTVTGLALTGADAGNYSLSTTSQTGAIGGINALQLTTPTLKSTISKTYDATTTATLTDANYNALTGVLGSDVVALNNPTSGNYSNKNVGSNKDVTVTGLALTGADAGNYSLSTTSQTGAIGGINALQLTTPTLKSTISKTYDATTTATLTDANYNALTGVLGSDVVALNNPTSGNYNNKNVGSNKDVTVTGLALIGADAGNYSLSTTSQTGAIGGINALQLTTPTLKSTISKTYDATTTATLTDANYNALTGVLGSNVVALNNPTSGNYNNKNVGSNKDVTVTGLALTGADAGNYSLSTTSQTGAIGGINALQLTTPTLKSTITKTYDATTTATLTDANYNALTGVLGSDVVALNNPTSGNYSNKNVGTNKDVTVTALALVGADAGNYTLSSTSQTGIIGSITALQLTTPTLTGEVSKTYNATTTATLTDANYNALTGVLGSDVVALNNPTSGTYNNKNVGTGKNVSVTGLALTGADAGNYTLSTTSRTGAIGTITQAGATTTLTGATEKTYDRTTAATLAAGNYSLSGIINGDVVFLSSIPTAGTYDTRNVGSNKVVSVDGLSLAGPDASNYAMASYASGAIGTITPATIVAGLTSSITRTYDATTAATLTAGNYTMTGVISGDSVSLNNPTSGTYDNKNVGTGKNVSVTGLALTGADAGNYTLSSTSSTGAIGSITTLQLTTPTLKSTISKTYDATTTATLTDANYNALTGVLGSDVVALNNPTSGNYNNKNVGTGKNVTVTGLALTGADAANYSLSSTSQTGAIGGITALQLTTPTLKSTITKTYDATTTATLTDANYNALTGVLGSDVVALNNPTSGNYSNKNVGINKDVTVTTLALVGADAGNYSLSSTSQTGVIGSITALQLITPTLTGEVSKTYNATTTATLTDANYNALTGVLGSDVVALNNPTSGTYNNKNVGTSKNVSVTGLALTGADAGNYTLSTTSRTGAIGTITQAGATTTLTGATEKTYDRTTAATLAAGNYSLSGIISGDVVFLSSIPTAGTYDTVNVGTNKVVSVDGLSLAGPDASNYAMASYASGAIGKITPATLTASLTSSVSRTYDATTAASLAAGNYSISGVISGDAVSLNNPTSGTFDNKNVGTNKIISVSGLALVGASASNYTLMATDISGAIGEINPAALTANLIRTISKVYDGSVTASLTNSNYSLSGIFGSDIVSLNNPTLGTYNTPTVGTNKPVTVTGLAISGLDANNYALIASSITGDIGSITEPPAPPTVIPENGITFVSSILSPYSAIPTTSIGEQANNGKSSNVISTPVPLTVSVEANAPHISYLLDNTLIPYTPNAPISSIINVPTNAVKTPGKSGIIINSDQTISLPINKTLETTTTTRSEENNPTLSQHARPRTEDEGDQKKTDMKLTDAGN